MSECLFCKIVKGEIKANKVFENDSVCAFEDINPQAKVHLLFINKQHTCNVNEMNEAEIGQVFKAIAEFTTSNNLSKSGFRVVTNTGPDACQSVFHAHFHVLGGEQLAGFGS